MINVLLLVTETDNNCVSNGPASMPVSEIICDPESSSIVMGELGVVSAPTRGGSLTGVTVTIKSRWNDRLSPNVDKSASGPPSVTITEIIDVPLICGVGVNFRVPIAFGDV